MHTRPFSPLLPALLLFVSLTAAAPNFSEAAEAPAGSQAVSQAGPVSVSHPAEVGDGTAFPCTIVGQGLVSATVTFLKRSVTVKPANARPDLPETMVLLPVPLDHASGREAITWSAKLADGSTVTGKSPVRVVARKYPVQKLTVAPKYVTPDPALKERIDRERKLMGAAQTTRSGTRHWNVPMLRPVPGKITSLYGLRRVFNGQPRSPHKGLDFRAPQGDPIAAIADGTVVLTGDFYYAGKFVVLDHGLGVTSISMHMSEIVAEQGQSIKQGEVIGLVGSTGRSTGPHLHLGITVLGQSIDALPLIAQTEQDKADYAAMLRASEAPAKKPAKKAVKQGGKKSGAKTAKKNAAKSGKKTAAKPAKAPRAAKSGQQGTAGTGAEHKAP